MKSYYGYGASPTGAERKACSSVVAPVEMATEMLEKSRGSGGRSVPQIPDWPGAKCKPAGDS
eukprot:scaffold34940_cov246-Amphora_coffeaeformis.AAC.2